MFADTLRDARKLCAELQLAPDALDLVFNAKGWSFFIQASALLEAAVNHALTKRVVLKKSFGQADPERVSSFLERLPMRGRSGRIALLELVDFFPEPMLAQVEVFFTIRNAYAHDIRLVSVSCADLVRELPVSERNRIVKVMITQMLGSTDLEDPCDAIEGVAHLLLLGLLSWIANFKSPKGLLSLAFAAAEQNAEKP